jgi:acyl-CoA synthetase (AMP-forming)/AMP-acid ligase II
MDPWAAEPAVSRLGDLARHQAAGRPQAPALICSGREISYGELDALVDRGASALLAAGVTRGRRVAMATPPCWEQVVVFLACARLGAAFVGLDPRHPSGEREAVLRDARPKLVIARRDVPHLLEASAAPPAEVERACADVNPSDAVAVVYTSGSTGARKGVRLTSERLLWAFWPPNAELRPRAPIRCLNDLPVDHLGGLVERVLPPLLTGGAVVLHERFDPRAFVHDACAHEVTCLHGEVTQWLRCVELDEFRELDLSSVEVAFYTGAAAPARLLEQLAARFPRVATGYGLTETGGPVTLTDEITPGAPTGLVGRPLRGIEVRIVDGIIHVRGGPGLPGWLDTGDMGEVLPDGSLRLVGRATDMYKSGGYNVHPREVEATLESHPDIAAVAVVSVPDPLFQEVGVAFVVARARASVDAVELGTFCRERLARHKVPKAFHVRLELPLLGNGKVDKQRLRRIDAERSTR